MNHVMFLRTVVQTGRKLRILIIWLNPQAAKMKQIVHCDWITLPYAQCCLTFVISLLTALPSNFLGRHLHFVLSDCALTEPRDTEGPFQS